MKTNPVDTFPSIIESIVKVALDTSLNYRQIILKGDMAFFFSLFHIIKNCTNVKPETFFILIEPLLKLIPDQESKIIIASANTLIKLLKNHNKLFLKFFTRIFEALIQLKLNQDQEVRNAGNALDEFLKDAIGNTFQGIIPDSSKIECDFSIEFLIQKINKENCHPAIQILIVSWITFIEAIPHLKMINYLTKIIPDLLNMLSDKIKDVYQCAEQCLRKISIGIEAHYEDLCLKHFDILNIIVESIIENCKNNNEKVRTCAFEWLLMFLTKYNIIIQDHLRNNKEEEENKLMPLNGFNKLISKVPCELFSKILEVFIINVYTPNKQIESLLTKANNTFLTIVLSIPMSILGDNVKQLELVLKNNLENSRDQGITLILTWCHKLFDKFNCKMFNNAEDFIEKFTAILSEKNETTFNEILSLLCSIAQYKESYSQTIVSNITNKLMQCRSVINTNGITILKSLSNAIHVTIVYKLFADILLKNKDIPFVIGMINILDIFLLVENESQPVRETLRKFTHQNRTEENSLFFEKIFRLWSYNPISTLILCVISEYFELSYSLTLKLAEMKLCQEDYIQLSQMIQLIESSLFNNIRIKLLEPFKHLLLVKTLYAILMLLPQGQAYNALCNRLKSIEIIIKLEGNELIQEMSTNGCISSEKKQEVDYFIQIFIERQNKKRNCKMKISL